MQETVYKHSTSIQIRFNDIDGLRHVNNATIQEYFDLGRLHYLKDVFGPGIFKDDETIIVASINTDFFCPVYLHDDIEVKTSIVHLGNKSLKMEQQLVIKNSKAVKAVCKSVMVAFNKESEDAIVIKDEWRKMIKKYEGKEL